MREDKIDLSQWHPRELIVAAKTLGLSDFLVTSRAAFMLVVSVDPNDHELAQGLNAGGDKRGEGETLAFRTATGDLSATIADDIDVRPARPSLAFQEQTSSRFPSALRSHRSHVVPIRKRSEVSFLHHVSIGRARNHDIVLRHKSVSKFHAWLELTPDVRLFVKDCESSNHTFLNDVRVRDREEVQAGDTLRFGAVEGRICTAEGLWRIMHAGAL